jgi:hypothetical protein
MLPRFSTGFLRWICLCVAVSPLARAADALETADKSAAEWIKLQLENSRAESDWRTQRELLTTLVNALNERASLLEEKRELAKAATAKERDELDGMRAKNLAASNDLKALEERLEALSIKLIALRPSLPPHLSDALEMSYRSLASADLPVGERMQVAMTVLNRSAQFNRQVTTGEDVLSLDGEPPQKSFEVIYWGLSHGYAMDPAAHKAWLGRPQPGAGWRWEPKPEAFDAVVKLIAVANDKADPVYVAVPAAIVRSANDEPRK